MMTRTESRLATELELLQAMYPGQLSFSSPQAELNYDSGVGILKLRLPDEYPEKAKPIVISAQSREHASDVREAIRQAIAGLEPGQEILDTIVSDFDQLCLDAGSSLQSLKAGDLEPPSLEVSGKKCTMVIWLHHLLNTNKRKQVLATSSSRVTGLSKPGYPGVLVFSGPHEDVLEHVNGLKSLKWQAFQVRLESEDALTFLHGAGVKEVETMADLVKDMPVDFRDYFLEAVKIK